MGGEADAIPRRVHGAHADDGLPYWNQRAEAVAAALGSGATGLSSDAARGRLAEVGSNTVETSANLGALRLLLRQFASPLTLILVFAAAVSYALQVWIDATIILVIVLGSSVLGFSQEYRASRAVEALQSRLTILSRVVRDGVEQSVPIGTIVPGDLILLSAGALVPADGLVLEASDFLVSEAGITGESFPVEKRPGTVPAEAPLPARTNAVFLGASARSGTAKVLAVRTGRQTEFGAIAARLRARAPETDFGRGVRQFGGLLIRMTVVLVLFTIVINLLLRRPIVESLLFAVALAVGLSPELLPAIVSVTLTVGALALSRRGVIVRRLESIENLGSMDILCTDKTGTLTDGTIVLRDALDAEGRTSGEIRRLAFVNATFETGIENPLDAAIIAAGKDAGLDVKGLVKIDEIPYDFIRRRLTIVAREDASAHRVLVTKGAVENVLEICSAIDLANGEAPLDAEWRGRIGAIFKAKSEEGHRVLALATKRVPEQPNYDRGDEHDMVLRGLLVFYDPPKPEAASAIRDLSRMGVAIKVISGDNRFVTAYLARALELDVDAMLTGEEVARLSDEALGNLAPRIGLFVEIDPQQKERIVRALQRAGHSVGYLGDGINDAPALHAADIGISVLNAADVARESAGIVLLSRDLDVLRAGVEEGRRTFANTLKYISITTSANFGNMVSMALAAPMLPFLPLAAKQILLNNFLSDIPSLAISSDNVDPERVARSQQWNVGDIRHFMIVFGLVSSAFDLLTFAALILVFHASESAFQTSWFLISLLTELAVALVLRTRRPAWRSRPSRLLLGSTAVVAAVAVAIPHLWPLTSAFGFVPLSSTEMAFVVAIVAGYILATEAAKAWFYRSKPP